ncbi:MAG: cysteine--tRNA ligase [Phycisphaeraceae bacterium]|nr:cysteine--tRNA ligase [Phycisphaeraceae bacterium]
MELHLYNSLSRQLEPFRPIDPAGRRVLFYTCGPTVYDYAHIGNFRSFLNADVLRRTLELLGFEVRQVMNMTDVGHMTEDDRADGGGEDKMAVAQMRLSEAKKSGRLPEGTDLDPNDPTAVAQFYIDAFLEDARRLGLRVVADADRDPAVMPRPTRYIAEMIALIRTLIDRGHAYVGADGVVYFDVQSFPAYGRLSGNTPDRVRSGEGGRVDAATQNLKRHPADFMLWKPDPRHVMRWPSPWGEGYPGWHLECSAMAIALLGAETGGVIDLHSGGEDNIFPHHECEIAQACGATGRTEFSRYWFHTRFLLVENEKMSKSRGNFFTVRDLVQRGASPAAIRLELIRTHYRSNANFTFQGVRDSQRQIDRWARLDDWLERHAAAPLPMPGAGPLEQAMAPFTRALCDDLNIAGAVAALNEAAGAWPVDRAPDAGAGPRTFADERRALRRMDSVLGVLDLSRDAAPEEGGDAARIESLIRDRIAARAAKAWQRADAIRDELLAMGVEIKDGPEGTTWRRVLSATPSP